MQVSLARVVALNLAAVVGITAMFPRPCHAQTTTFSVLGNGKTAPVVFEADSKLVKPAGNAFHVTGDVRLRTALGALTLAKAELIFEHAPGKPQQIISLRGKAAVPPPYASPNVRIKDLAMADVGLDLGRNIKLGVPLQPDTAYLFFHFDTGLNIELGATGNGADHKPITIEVPVGAEGTLIMDPSDPFYFQAGALLPSSKDKDKGTENDKNKQDNGDSKNGQNKDGKPEDEESIVPTGIGRSQNGRIPFIPANKWGIEDKAKPFNGHQIQQGTFPLGTLPIEVTGTMITNINAAGSGKDTIDPFGVGFGPSAKLGANGEMAISCQFLEVARLGKIAEFSIPLGEATAAVEVTNNVQHAYFAGYIDPDTTWLPDFVPLKPAARIQARGYISSKLTDSQLMAVGRFQLDASSLGKMANLDLKDVLVVDGELQMDSGGFRLKASGNVVLGPIAFSGKTGVELFIAPGAQDSFLRLSGDLRIAGAATTGVVSLSPTGPSIQGELVTQGFSGQVAATIGHDREGFYAAGSLSVDSKLNDAVGGAVAQAAATAQAEIDKAMANLEAATKDYEIELSLRGLRGVIPRLVDGILATMDQQIKKQVNANWPKPLGVEAPGKSVALKEANRQAEPHRKRLRAVKAAVLEKDSDKARAALKAALSDLVAKKNRRLVIEVKPLGKFYDAPIMTDKQASQLQTGIKAIDALPATNDRMIKARDVVAKLPKRELLQAAAQAVKAGAAGAPRVKSISFRAPLGSVGAFKVSALVEVSGKEQTLALDFDPQKSVDLPAVLGKAVASSLK